MLPQHRLFLASICFAKSKEIRIFCQPHLGDNRYLTIGKLKLNLALQNEFAQFLKWNFEFTKPDLCMDVEPVDAFLHLHLDHRFTDEIFLVPALGLAYFKAQVKQVYAVFVQPGERLRFGNGHSEALHRQTQLLQRMQERFFSFRLSSYTMEDVAFGLLFNGNTHGPDIVATESVLTVFER